MIELIKSVYSHEFASVNRKKDQDQKITEIIVKNETLLTIMKTQSLRKHIILTAVINYSITLAHYGSIFFVNYLKINRHIMYISGSCAEIIGMLLLYFLLKQFGTKFTLMLYLFVLAFLFAVLGLIFFFVQDDDVKGDEG